MRRRLYLQICAISFASLFLFALLAAFLWGLIGHEEQEHGLFQKTTVLAELLLPPADADAEAQRAVVERIAAALEFDITLLHPNGALIAATGGDSAPVPEMAPGDGWKILDGSSRYATKLTDGRVLSIKLDRLALPSESASMAMSLAVVAVFISAMLYPFIRYVTGRLERLQREVERVGSGDLSARVEVRGDDEIARLANSFNSATEKIERLVTSQRMLLANASHELRTPLARIRLGIDMLLSRGDASYRSALEQDIKELDTLIEELLLMTRLDSAAGLHQHENVDLLAIAAEEGARFEGCSIVGDSAEISGDPRLLQRLTRNLIDNARKYGATPITVSVKAADGYVELSVADDGPGIPEADLEKVFEPFYRAPDTQNIDGHGLGLPLVRSIAVLHGGAVEARTRPHSSVTVRLPRLYARF